MKPNLTKDQRKRLFLLARLLDRVPKSNFDMKWWITVHGDSDYNEGNLPKHFAHLAARECGFAGCAIGWGLTDPRISRGLKSPHDMIKSLGLPCMGSDEDRTSEALFAASRKVGPRTVAADIRRYLKDGTLPKE